MSTTFGIRISTEDNEDEHVEVARRTNGYIIWLNPIASLLDNAIEVIPLDNSSQGIYTIGDIKKAIDKESI